MLTAALKPDLEPVFTPTPEWFPTEFWEWDNFRRVLTEVMPFLRYMINTMIIVVGEHPRRADLVLARRASRSRGCGSAGARCSSTS